MPHAQDSDKVGFSMAFSSEGLGDPFLAFQE
jgi:hypothetical protein